MKVRSNRWLSRIEKTLGESDSEKAVQALVRRFRPENETLESITRQLDVAQIVMEPLPFDGGVYEVDGRRLIKLNSLALPVRQKFTLAHEIGHLILERTLKAATACASDEHLERACDILAAELLMPAAETRALAKEVGNQSPEKLGMIANRFAVSLKTAAQRLHDLGLWKMGIGMWKCGSTSEQLWYVGKRPWKTDCPSFSVFQLAIESSVPVCTSERFPRGPGSDTELVGLKAHHIGKNYVVAVVATTAK